jgi:hypothetical protein
MLERLRLTTCLCVIFLICTTCSSASVPAKIFFINLFDDVVDIRLGDQSEPVFQVNSVVPYSFSAMAETHNLGKHVLFFKSSIQTEWNSWSFTDYNGTCHIESGKIYCISITADGSIHYFTMSEDNKQGAKVCFFNASPFQVADMRIAADALEHQIASIQDLESNTLSNFYTVPPGNYLLFWQFPLQQERGEFFFYTKNKKNKPEPLVFLDTHYYVFLIYIENDAPKALFFDITPF